MTFLEDDIRPDKLASEQRQNFNIDIKNLQKRLNEFVLVNCPACDKDSYSFKFEKYKFKYVECKHCRTTYVNPRPNNEIINWYYKNSKNYQFWNKYIFPLTEKNRIESIIKPRLKKLIRICDEFKVSKQLFLEIGPGFGTFGKELVKEDYFDNYLAIEPMPDLAKSCKEKGLDVIEQNIEELNRMKMKASVVASFEVIEHLFSPLLFVQGIKKHLKKNGLMFLTCPNIFGFETKILGKISDTFDVEHLNYFNINSLSKLLESNGFDVLHSSTPGMLDTDIVRKKIISGEFKIKDTSFLNTISDNDFNKYIRSFQTFLQENNLSTHMWVVAKKK